MQIFSMFLMWIIAIWSLYLGTYIWTSCFIIYLHIHDLAQKPGSFSFLKPGSFSCPYLNQDHFPFSYLCLYENQDHFPFSLPGSFSDQDHFLVSQPHNVFWLTFIFWQEDRRPLAGHRSILEKKIIKRSCVELNS